MFTARYELKLYIQVELTFDVKGAIPAINVSESSDLSDILIVSISGGFCVMWTVESTVVRTSCDELRHSCCLTDTSG